MKIWWTAGLLLLSGSISAAQDFKCEQDKSRAEVQRLTQAGTIVSVDQFPPFITVVVNDRPWGRLELEAKKAMAARRLLDRRAEQHDAANGLVPVQEGQSTTRRVLEK